MHHPWLLFYLITIIFLTVSLTSFVSAKEQKICETQYCKELAESYLRNKNSSVNPCDDFFEYACGLWGKYNPIPAHEYRWSIQDVIEHQTRERLKNLLMEDVKPTDIPAVKAAKEIYRSCINTDAIEGQDIYSILSLLKKTGGWPLAMETDKWDPKKISWQEIDKLHFPYLTRSTFFKVVFEPESSARKDKYIMVIYNNLHFPVNYKLTVDNVLKQNDPYADGIVRIALAIAAKAGQKLDKHQLAQDVVDLVTIEFEILNMVLTARGPFGMDQHAETMTLGELQTWYDGLNNIDSRVKLNFMNVLKYVFKLAGEDVDESEPVIVYNKEVYEEIAKYLQTVPDRAIVNLVQWNLINSLISYTTTDMSNIKFDMLYADLNVTGYPPRWLSCITDLQFAEVISYMFVTNYSSSEVTEKGKILSEKLRGKLIDKIKNSVALSPYLLDAMRDKVENIEHQIGYPKWMQNSAVMIEKYKGLQTGLEYFQNVLNYKQFNCLKDIREFRQTNTNVQWLAEPTEVNAFYSPNSNTLFVPASELQEPYFTESLPDAINYAGPGFIIGHEMCHSLDALSIQKDRHGNQKQFPNWFFHLYNQKTECFVNKYGNYSLKISDSPPESVSIDGLLTLNENLADVIGLEIVYSIYKDSQKNAKYEMKLPGLESLSEDQFFFVAFANSWCSIERPDFVRYTYDSFTHSPLKYRVIGAVSNMKEFAEAYNCPVGSVMNPATKCTLWK